MQVNIIRAHDDVLSIDLQADNIKSILSGLKLHFGQALTDSLLSDGYRYVLLNKDAPESAVAVVPEVMMSPFTGYDTLVIVRDIDGEATAAGVAGYLGVSLFWGAVIAIAINIAVSIAISAIMQAISPTPEFSSDPATAQASNKRSALFNGAPVIREQGGVVPWILGAPYCGGVLISSGVSSEDF